MHDARVLMALAECHLHSSDLELVYGDLDSVSVDEIVNALNTFSKPTTKHIFLSNGICEPKEQLDYALRCSFPKENWVTVAERELSFMAPNTLPNKYINCRADLSYIMDSEFLTVFSNVPKYHKFLAFLLSEYGDGCAPSDISLKSFKVSEALATQKDIVSMISKITDSTDLKDIIQLLDILLSFNPNEALDFQSASLLIKRYVQNGINNYQEDLTYV